MLFRSDGVVGKTRFGVQAGRALVHLHRQLDRAGLQMQVTDLIEDREIVVQVGRVLELTDESRVDLDRLVELPLELESAGVFLGFLDVQERPRRGW